jgi:21S rRNA (GM2251-2'-O)-methyltransferase
MGRNISKFVDTTASLLPIANIAVTTTTLHITLMVYPFLTGSTLLRTQRTILPRTFLRYKSITSAIERGRNDGPDRPFRPRTRSFNDGGNGNGDGEVKTRREARFEKFGPARDEASPREVRTTSPRSSRFGRVPRDDDAPSRVDNRETRPPRPWEGRGRQGPGTGFPGQQEKWQKQTMSPWTLAGHNRLDNEGSPVKDSMQGENSAREERAPRPERRFDRTSTPFGDRPARDFGRDDRGGERRQFGRDDRGGERRDFNRDFKRDDGGGERKPFARDDRGGERRGFGGDDRGGERKPFSRDDRGGDRKPFSRDDRGGERKPFNRDDRGGERKPFSRDDRGGERRDFTRDDRGGERKEFSRDERRERPDFKQERPERFTPRDGDAPPSTFRPRDTTNREPRFTHHPDSKGARRERTGREDTDAAPSSSPAVLRGPESLPYTTAASEFIYGHSSVLAAIKANRRKFYTLYVHSRGASRDGLMSRIRAHKLFSITQEVGDEYMRALDKASSGRPHNGVVMESSPLPVPPITELKTSSMEDESFGVGLDSQSKEDEEVNGKSEIFPYKSAGWRNPLVLYVDGVVSSPISSPVRNSFGSWWE